MKVHGKDTEITVDGDAVTTATNSSQHDREADEHDITCYGTDDYEFGGGLRKGAFTMSGIYADGATGPGAILRPLIGQVVPIVRKPEGTGTGKPQESFNGLIKKYTETNPVAGYITWQCDVTRSGAITDTTQS
jgi:hypothetical protein